MKKLTLVATAVLGLVSSAAMAQSTVTVYGLLDAGYNRVTGLAAGTANHIASGIMEGSRFGLKGTEDIGGGYKAIFTLENRLELDTGSVSNRPPSGGQLPDRIALAPLLLPGVANLGPLTAAQTAAAYQGALSGVAYGAGGTALSPAAGSLGSSLGVNLAGNLFDRQAFMGLITPVGAITLGRQYTPGYLVGATFDASQTQSSLAAGQAGGFPPSFDIRLSNTIQYGIQTNGVTAALMYGAGEVAGNSSAGRFWGAMGIYKGDGWSVGLGHNRRNNDLGQSSLKNNVIGGTFDVGPGTLYAQYATSKDENPIGSNGATIQSGVTAALTPSIGAALGAIAAANIRAGLTQALMQDSRLMHIGYRMTTGPHTVVVAYNRFDDKRPNNADTTTYGATYTYALSKRTNLNAVLTRFNNKGLGQSAPGGNGFLGGVTATAGQGSTNLALGVRHVF